MADEVVIDPNYRNPAVSWQLLAKLSIFKGLSEKELREIYALGEIRVYHPTSNIIIEGEQSSGLYVVLEGAAAVFKSSINKFTGHKIASLEKSEAFGELSLLDKCPRSATVAAESTVIAFYLDGKSWDNYSQKEPLSRGKFMENCALMLSRRMRDLDEAFLESQGLLWKFVLKRSTEAGEELKKVS